MIDYLSLTKVSFDYAGLASWSKGHPWDQAGTAKKLTQVQPMLDKLLARLSKYNGDTSTDADSKLKSLMALSVEADAFVEFCEAIHKLKLADVTAFKKTQSNVVAKLTEKRAEAKRQYYYQLEALIGKEAFHKAEPALWEKHYPSELQAIMAETLKANELLHAAELYWREISEQDIVGPLKDGCKYLCETASLYSPPATETLSRKEIDQARFTGKKVIVRKLVA